MKISTIKAYITISISVKNTCTTIFSKKNIGINYTLKTLNKSIFTYKQNIHI